MLDDELIVSRINGQQRTRLAPFLRVVQDQVAGIPSDQFIGSIQNDLGSGNGICRGAQLFPQISKDLFGMRDRAIVFHGGYDFLPKFIQ
jgi:hypothetical protein